MDTGYDVDKVLTTDDLVPGRTSSSATGVTTGALLKGVRYTDSGAITDSARDAVTVGNGPRIEATHSFEKLMKFSGIAYRWKARLVPDPGLGGGRRPGARAGSPPRPPGGHVGDTREWEDTVRTPRLEERPRHPEGVGRDHVVVRHPMISRSGRDNEAASSRRELRR